MLAALVRRAGPDVRVWHPTGRADPAGFAAMGCAEALLHGDDIARGLGVALDPPRAVCARVLARLFPRAARRGVDPWAALRWSTGRAELPGHPRLTEWHWQATPPDPGSRALRRRPTPATSACAVRPPRRRPR
ncbi:hypothetical protein ACFY3U_09300 [Micromonospora sp. NPDC000089]|uniref:hypothetical protein n=1 Tax=unclassified Micromonospora TaxID=2617518 RepID=UPI0036AC9557